LGDVPAERRDRREGGDYVEVEAQVGQREERAGGNVKKRFSLSLMKRRKINWHVCPLQAFSTWAKCYKTFFITLGDLLFACKARSIH